MTFWQYIHLSLKKSWSLEKIKMAKIFPLSLQISKIISSLSFRELIRESGWKKIFSIKLSLVTQWRNTKSWCSSSQTSSRCGVLWTLSTTRRLRRWTLSRLTLRDTCCSPTSLKYFQLWGLSDSATLLSTKMDLSSAVVGRSFSKIPAISETTSCKLRLVRENQSHLLLWAWFSHSTASRSSVPATVST